MKVHIVYLSPTDDIDSTRDMLGWVQAPRALLVWPSEGKVLMRHYDLVLLKRFADQRNVVLGLLTFDSEVRKSAEDLGFPIFESLEDLPEEKWSVHQHSILEFQDPALRARISRPGEIEPGWVSRLSPQAIRPFVLGLGVLILGIWVLLIPSAEVVLSPPHELLEHEILIPSEAVPGVFNGIRFGKYEVTVSAQATGKTTGIARIPVAAAHGEVLFTNLSTEEIMIPAHTELRSLGTNTWRFETISAVVLPGEPSAKVLAPVNAMTLGEGGNRSAGEAFAVQGSLGLVLSATNPRPFVGGSDKLLNSVSSSDYANLLADLTTKLLKTAESRLQVDLSDSEYLIEGSAIILDANESSSHKINEIADSFQLSLELETEMIVLSRVDLEKALEEAFVVNLPQGYQLAPNSLSYHVEPVRTGVRESIDHYRVVSTARSFQELDQGKIVTAVRGRTLEAAIQHLTKELPAVFQTRITQHPTWFPILPLLGSQIETQYEWDV